MFHPSSLLLFIAGAAITAALYEVHINSWFVRPAFRVDCSRLLHRKAVLLRLAGGSYDVVCGDIDKMKVFNDGPTDYALVNGIVRGAVTMLRVRSGDHIILGQYLEGDELIAIIRRRVPCAGLVVAQRLQQCFAQQPIPVDERERLAAAGISCLSATMTVVEDVPADKIMAAAARGMSATAARKRGDARGTIGTLPWIENGCLS